VSLHVGTGKAKSADGLLDALARGRNDRQFFSQVFLGRTLHDGQLEYVENAKATVNVLPTSNRWGKTTVLSNVHNHACVYKTGAESRYLDDAGDIDIDRFVKVRYNTIHAAGDWETAALVWDDEHKIINESSSLAAFIRNAPRSKPPHVDFIHGARWKFRTLGDNASGIDGNSFYIISLDEGGWLEKLAEMMDNVIRVRVADVRGCIHVVGTMKPGVSRDFYHLGVRAAARNGAAIALDHRGDPDEEGGSGLDASIRKYVREWIAREKAKDRLIEDEVWEQLARIGIEKSEYADVMNRG
jgi:hypothetical protein